MEKTWEDFLATGKVTDYLNYRNAVEERGKQDKEQKDNGTAGERDGYGPFRHACR